MTEKTSTVPWVPGLYRPKYFLPRITISMPTRVPPQLIYFVLYAGIFYVFCGGVYDLVNKPYARGSDSNGNPVLLLPSKDQQFLLEGIVAAMVMFMGSIGLWFMNQATVNPEEPARARSYQIIGALLVAFAFFILNSMYKTKIGQ